MYACHNGAKNNAKVHPCQQRLNMLIIKGFMGVILAETKAPSDSRAAKLEVETTPAPAGVRPNSGAAGSAVEAGLEILFPHQNPAVAPPGDRRPPPYDSMGVPSSGFGGKAPGYRSRWPHVLQRRASFRDFA